jgi:ribonuclease D
MPKSWQRCGRLLPPNLVSGPDHKSIALGREGKMARRREKVFLCQPRQRYERPAGAARIPAGDQVRTAQQRGMRLSYSLHKDDLPAGLEFGPLLAIDTETLGLDPHRDRLCLMQLSSGDGTAHLVQFRQGRYEAPNLVALLSDPKITKLFHFARFDLAVIRRYLGVVCEPVYCTKIASKLVRTYTDRHGLRDLCRELLGVDISKQNQSSDWGAETLSDSQLAYAAGDVLYLHRLHAALEAMLVREGRQHLAAACFQYLNTRAEMDLGGWQHEDIFAH